MAKGDHIKNGDTIARYVPGGRIDKGRPMAKAYELSDTDKKAESPHLSVNWLEFFADKNTQGQVDEVRAILDKKLKIKKSACLALLNIENIHLKLAQNGLTVSILHWPDVTECYNDQSHSGIFFDVERDADVIALALSQINCNVVPDRKPDEPAA